MAPAITCHCGECVKCKHRVYMRDYYSRNAQKVRDTALASRARRLEDVRAYDRARGYRVYDEAKVKARRVIGHAVARGRVTAQPCEVCGLEQVDAHHDDYAKPLEVRWLCRKHHGELHRVFV